MIREREAQCPVFAERTICEADADSRLPAHGVPEHVRACALEVDGSEQAIVRLQGPASKAPDVGHQAEAADESEEACDCDDRVGAEKGGASQLTASAETSGDVAAVSIAVDPVRAVKPVKMMQALQANIEALQKQAATILRNEKKARVLDKDGAPQCVPDEGGRQCLQSVILDLQSAARTFDDAAQASIEHAVSECDRRLSVCSSALATPTQGPLDSFSARTWPACYAEWRFGDGAPGLDRGCPYSSSRWRVV